MFFPDTTTQLLWAQAAIGNGKIVVAWFPVHLSHSSCILKSCSCGSNSSIYPVCLLFIRVRFYKNCFLEIYCLSCFRLRCNKRCLMKNTNFGENVLHSFYRKDSCHSWPILSSVVFHYLFWVLPASWFVKSVLVFSWIGIGHNDTFLPICFHQWICMPKFFAFDGYRFFLLLTSHWIVYSFFFSPILAEYLFGNCLSLSLYHHVPLFWALGQHMLQNLCLQGVALFYILKARHVRVNFTESSVITYCC